MMKSIPTMKGRCKFSLAICNTGPRWNIEIRGSPRGKEASLEKGKGSSSQGVEHITFVPEMVRKTPVGTNEQEVVNVLFPTHRASGYLPGHAKWKEDTTTSAKVATKVKVPGEPSLSLGVAPLVEAIHECLRHLVSTTTGSQPEDEACMIKAEASSFKVVGGPTCQHTALAARVDALVASSARLAGGDLWRCTPMETAPLTALPNYTDEGHTSLHTNLIGRLREVQRMSHKVATQVCDIGAAVKEMESQNRDVIQKLTEEALQTSMELDQ